MRAGMLFGAAPMTREPAGRVCESEQIGLPRAAAELFISIARIIRRCNWHQAGQRF
jgi:hypothetical protein